MLLVLLELGNMSSGDNGDDSDCGITLISKLFGDDDGRCRGDLLTEDLPVSLSKPAILNEDSSMRVELETGNEAEFMADSRM